METKNIIYIANLLLTRKCNLNCSYCNLIKDYDNKPEQYPLIRDMLKNEISAKRWIEIIKRIRKNNSKCFFILYGGEPLLYEGLADIINFCNIENINYTLISNNTDYAYSKFEELLTKVEYVKGYTASVDPLIYDKNIDNDIKEKSKAGLKRLIEIKNKFKNCDIVAEITLTSQNIKYLNRLLTELSKHKIYASITCIDLKKNKYYDFSAVKDENSLIFKAPNIKRIFNTVKKHIKDGKYLIHCPDMIDHIYNTLPCNMFCNLNNNIHNITIDSDGCIRTCLRIRGIHTPQLKIEEAINDNGIINKKFNLMITKDIQTCCDKCNWTCVLMSRLFNQDIIH